MSASRRKLRQVPRHGAFYMIFRQNVSHANGKLKPHQKGKISLGQKLKKSDVGDVFLIPGVSFTMNLFLKAKL